MDDIKRPVKRIERSPQLSLLEGAVPTEEERRAQRNDSGFVDPDPEELYFGSMRLRSFLEQMGMGWVIELRKFIRSLDFSAFEEAYSLQGRPPYAPASMVGLILYGLIKGRRSLRELEEMARSDLGAMWMSGGIFPDHSVLGRFLVRHQDALTVVMFEDLTRRIIEECALDTSVMAADGTIIEAASSRFSTVTLEAAEAYADKLREESADEDEDGDDEGGVAEKLRRAEEVVEAGRQRARQQRKSKKASAKLQMVETELDAALVRTKRGVYAAGYTPSVTAIEQRVIVGVGVDATSEIATVEPMLDQIERITGRPPQTLLMDATYHRTPVVELAVERDIDLLSPSPGQARKMHPSSVKGKGRSSKFKKTEFTYRPEDDVLECPAGQLLKPGGFQQDGDARPYRVFYPDAHKCNRCDLRTRCTESSRGRRVKRFKGEELLDTLKHVMGQAGARKKYTTRKGMAEPAIAALKSVLGLRRFTRWGLRGVKLELVLAATALNLRRWLRLTGLLSPSGRFFALYLTIQRCLSSLTGLNRFRTPRARGNADEPSFATAVT